MYFINQLAKNCSHVFRLRIIIRLSSVHTVLGAARHRALSCVALRCGVRCERGFIMRRQTRYCMRLGAPTADNVCSLVKSNSRHFCEGLVETDFILYHAKLYKVDFSVLSRTAVLRIIVSFCFWLSSVNEAQRQSVCQTKCDDVMWIMLHRKKIVFKWVGAEQGLNYFQRGVGALPIQWPMVEICELRCNAKICDFMQVIIAII